MASSFVGVAKADMENKTGLEDLVAGIDRGIEAHMAWNQRLIRCSLLHHHPEPDMLRTDAHELCEFGQWFAGERAQLNGIAPELASRTEQYHTAMHAAVRDICQCVVGGEPVDARDLDQYESAQSSMVMMLNELRGAVTRSAAHHDPLTGLPLRHSLRFAFDSRVRDAVRAGLQLHLAMVDVDHFKRVNDRHGHPVGDDVLRNVARVLAQCMRANDCLIRYGGEEFLAILLIDHEAALEQVAQRMLEAVRQAQLVGADHQPIALTVTIGLARVLPGEVLEEVIKRADDALLAGKAAGRNRFVQARA